MSENLVKGTSLWQDAWKRLRKNKMAVGSAIVLIFLIVACFAGPMFIEMIWATPTMPRTWSTGRGAQPWPTGSARTSTDGTS